MTVRMTVVLYRRRGRVCETMDSITDDASCVPQMRSSPNVPGLPMLLLLPDLSVSLLFNQTFGMYLSRSLFTLYLLTCQVRVDVGDSGLCCYVRVASFER